MLFKQFSTYFFHFLLFCIAFVTTTLAGSEWMFGKTFFLGSEGFKLSGYLSKEEIFAGLQFSVPFLGVLTFHEFGHYFTARYYKEQVTLPYYLPFWTGVSSSLGTVGAFIKIKSRIRSNKRYFDIGIAGPLAGFVVAVPLLFYGFTHLPKPQHIFSIHPEYAKYGLEYAKYVYDGQSMNIALGKNLLFLFFENFVADPALLPNKYELIHYPLLFSGYLALFFTALNLIPIGQLDGGHILYGLIGFRRFNFLSPILFTLFILYAGTGIISPEKPLDDLLWIAPLYLLYLYIVFKPFLASKKRTFMLMAAVIMLQYVLGMIFPGAEGYNGWLLFGLILSKFLGVFHPPCEIENKLSIPRQVLGWLALLIFALCFSPTPFIVE